MRPRLDLRPDRERQRVWVILDGQQLVSLREGDREGLKALTTWLVDAQIITVEEAAEVQGVRPRTVKAYQATYAGRGNSADPSASLRTGLVDRRRFNKGQQKDYRMEAHKADLIRCAAMNLVRGEKNSERGLAEEVGADEEARQKLLKNRRQVATRRANDQARLQEVEQEMAQLRQGEAPTNGLKLGLQDLKQLAKKLERRIAGLTARQEELDVWLKWADGEGPQPEEKQAAELDLTQESILTQLKLEVFTAQETLLDDCIEQALKPVLREEAEQQAAERRRLDKRSTARGREGKPLSTDVEELYGLKVKNLERETILKQLLNQRGEFVRHKTERLILMVADRFENRRMQAAYERYCVLLNQRDIKVPLDDGEPWRFLFTYHLDAPSSSAQFK